MNRGLARGLSLLARRAGRGLATDAGAPGEIGVVSGAPLDVLQRKVIIYSPARTAAQQGLSQTGFAGGPCWKIEFENTEKWENQLTGWTSTADPLENVSRSALAFYTKEEAMAFCVKHGWEAEVWEVNERKRERQKRFAGYGDNFSTKRSGVPDLSTYRSNRGVGSEVKAAAPPPPPPPPPPPKTQPKPSTAAKATGKAKPAASKSGKS